jgi:hypothetical protein
MWIIWDRRFSTKTQYTKMQWVNLEDEYDAWREQYDQCSNTSSR